MTHTRAIGTYVPWEGEGAGQVWDFSSLVPQQTFQHMFTDASASPYSKTYPNADWQLDEAGTAFFYSSTDSLTYYGGVQQGLVIEYSDPQSVFQYPMDIGFSSSDTFTGAYETNGLMVWRMGATEAACLGSGSLTLPNGQQFSEAYHVHVIETIQDSTVLGNYLLVMEGDYLLVPEWPLQVYGAIHIAVTDEISGSGTQMSSINSWLHSTAVGVDESLAEPFVLAPNPVRAGEPLTVIWSGEPQPLTVFNALGQEVHRTRALPGVEFTVIPTDGLSPGVHFIAAPNRGPMKFVVH